MSQVSALGGDMNYSGMDVEFDTTGYSMQPHNPSLPPPPLPPPPAMSPMMASPGMRASPFDRRRLFAKMKHNKPSSSVQSRDSSDGMPDVHMVDSTLSLMSNFSSQGGSKNNQEGIPSLSDHSIGVGSRRSLMSGLSKISDTSGIQSVFSDLSKKISNSSSRSISMSEFSDIQEAFNEDFDGFNFEAVTTSQTKT